MKVKKRLDLLIIDDHPLYIKGIRTAFENAPYINSIAEAVNGLSCVDLVRKHKPHVVLLDISMEDLDGVKCLKMIRARWKHQRVICLHRYDEIKLVNEVVKLGALGSIKKTVSAIKLREEFEFLMKLPKSDRHIEEELEIKLHPRELDVVRLLSKSLTSKEIGDRLCISKETVDGHRKRILKKTGFANTAGVVIWAATHGIV